MTIRMSRAAKAIALAGAAAIAAVCFVDVAPAGAATESGQLFLKGVGSVYGRQITTNMAAVPGRTTTFGLEVVNNGTVPLQYKLTFTPTASGSVTEAMYAGTTKLPNDYWTPLIAPGKTYKVAVKETPSATTPQTSYYSTIQLFIAHSNAALGYKQLAIHVAAPKIGTGPADLFLKNGTQATEGGSVGSQYLSAPSLAVGQSAKFTLTLQNDSATAHPITLQGSFAPEGSCNSAAFSVTFKKGTTDITAAVESGAGWATPTLAAGGKVVLTQTVKYAVVQPACNAYYTSFFTYVAGTYQLFESTQVTLAV
jgi:hypothetical protein